MDKRFATGSKIARFGVAITFIAESGSKMILASTSNTLQNLIGIGVTLITNEHMEP